MNIETFFNGDDAKRFFFPGKIFIGKKMAFKAAELTAEHRFVAIVVDHALAKSDIYNTLVKSIIPRRYITRIIQGAPYEQDIIDFIGLMKEPPDAIVSIGGGSATDFAKGVILHELFGTIAGVGIGDKLGLLPKPNSKKPDYIAIVTTAGSGAESSRYYVTYDKYDHGKVYGKTWNVVADWILLDPEVLSTIPDEALVGCAFDAFVHFFETFIARHECSLFGEMLSLTGIPRIMRALHAAFEGNGRDAKVHEELICMATLAGVAISNIRTGNIHEAAGALLELTGLSHAETLFVFFRKAVEQYSRAIGEQEKLLITHLRLIPAFAKFTSIEDVILWWEELFEKVGLTAKIKEEISNIRCSSDKGREHVFQRVYSDKVWITKENPIAMGEQEIKSFINGSLNSFGFKN